MASLARHLAGFPAPVWLLALALLMLVAVLPGAVPMPALDRDEAKLMQVSRQLVETGRPLDLRFQQESRAAMPPALHWLQAASASVLGGPDAPLVAFRLPGLLAAAAAVALTAWAAAPLLGAQGAILAGMILGSAGLTLVEARIGRADAVMLALVVLAQGILLRLWLAQAPKRWMAAVLWASVGLAVLTGGPMAAVPVLGTITALAIGERRLPMRALWPLGGLAIIAVLLVPWGVAAWLAPGRAGTGSVIETLVTLITGGSEGQASPPGTYLSLFFIAFWPLAALVPVALGWLWDQRRTRLAAFVLGWALPVWLIFEAVPAKLPHHMLLACPALAILLAGAFDSLAARAPDRFIRALLLAAFAAPALLLVGLMALAVPLVESRVAVWPLVAALVAAVPLALAGVALWRWQVDRFAGFGALGAVLGLGALLHLTIPALPTLFVAPRLAETVAAWRCGEAGPVAVSGIAAPSVVLALGADTIVTGGPGAGVMLADRRAPLAFVADDDMADFAMVTGPMATALARVEGVDLTRLRRVELTLYAMDRQGAAPCAP